MIVVYIIWKKKNGNDINKTILNNKMIMKTMADDGRGGGDGGGGDGGGGGGGRGSFAG